MSSPFPGMDPWLEQPGLWTDLHTSLIAALRDELGPLLRPRVGVRSQSFFWCLTICPSTV